MQQDRLITTHSTERLPAPAAQLGWDNGGASHGAALPWARYAAAVRRYRWVVVAVTLLGTTAGIFGSRLLHHKYAARAVLWVEMIDPRARAPDPLGASGLLGATGWVDLLRSHAVLDQVVREQRLSVSGDHAALRSLGLKESFRPGQYALDVGKDGARWTLATAGGAVLERGALGDSVGSELGFEWTPTGLRAGSHVAFTIVSHYEAARRLALDLRVATDLGGNFIRLEIRSNDPARGAGIANAVAERFVTIAAQLKRQKQSELARILGEQLQHARQNLAESEQALRAFLITTAPLLAQGTTGGSSAPRVTHPALANYLDLRGEQDQLRRDRLAIDRLLGAAGDSGTAVDALGLVGAVQRSVELSQALRELTTRQAELRALRYRYMDENPDVRRIARQVGELRRSTIPVLARALMDELGARDAEIRRLLSLASGDLRRQPALALEDARLRRDLQSAEEVFTRIQQRYGEAQLAEVSSLPDVRVLDAAQPPEVPLGDAGRLLIVLAMVGSLGAGVFGAVVREQFDRKVREPEQVADFGLRILGALPHLTADSASAVPVVDALRGIRLNLMHTYGAGRLMLTISSPSSGDGKSFLTSNLALAFADAGYRTLVVDGDLRRGALHRGFGARRLPGLTDVLAGDSSAEAAVQRLAHPGLSFLASGSRTRAAPELLSSGAMTQLLGDLRAAHDVLLIDSSPLAAGIEPYVFGTHTGNLLLVLRLGLTDGPLAQAKLDALDRLPIRVVGAVLNDVRSRDAYSRYSYSLTSYDLSDDGDAWAQAKIVRRPNERHAKALTTGEGEDA